MGVPLRHNKEAVRRYLPTMQVVAQNFPNVVALDPAPLAAVTFASRYRDAVRGIYEFGQYEDGDFTEEFYMSYLNILDLVRVSEHDGQILIGSKQTLAEWKNKKKPKVVGQVVYAEVAQLDETIDRPKQDVLEAIILLMHHDYIATANVSGVSEDTIAELVGDKNVEFYDTGNNVITLY